MPDTNTQPQVYTPTVPAVLAGASVSTSRADGGQFDPLAPVATPPPPPDPDEDYEDVELDYTADIEEDVYLIEQVTGGTIIPSLPLGNLSAVKAKAKSGKTFFCSILMSVVLGAQFMDMRCRFAGSKVLYVDTEQSKFNVVQVCRRVNILCGQDLKYKNPNFNCLFLRETAKKKRLKKIKKKIRDFQPQLVILDGLRDIIDDINSSQECSEIIEDLMALSSETNSCICCVLHENPGSDKMRGHAGTELLNKVTDVYELVRELQEGTEDYLFKVIETDSRQRPLRDAAFTIQDGSNGRPPIPVACANPHNFDPNKNVIDYKNKGKQPLPPNRTDLLTNVSNLRAGMSYSNLWEYIYNNYRCTQKEAQSIVKEGFERGLIYKSDTTKLIYPGPAPAQATLDLDAHPDSGITFSDTMPDDPLPPPLQPGEKPPF